MIEQYLDRVGESFRKFFLDNKEWFDVARHPHHPGKQKEIGGLKLHTLQVIKKALELNQTCDERELIEICLVHDIRGCEKLPLTDAQRLAVGATKGLEFKKWRHTAHYKFVALVLISDMWSAFINERDL